MTLSGPLLALLSSPHAGGVIAFVGGGGKSTALYLLAEELSEHEAADVLLTSTTHLFDPRLETGRPFDALILDPAMAFPATTGIANDVWTLPQPLPNRGRRVVLAAQEEPALGKLRGIHPSRVAELTKAWAWILVEADGAKHLPIKAPAPHEPVLPPGTRLVVGVIGLDALGRPMDETTVHRPDRFASATGCAPGAPIGLEHLAALCNSPQGLFKNAPEGARRVLLLNKADQCAVPAEELLAALGACADLVLVCALQGEEPAQRFLAQTEPTLALASPCPGAL